MKSMADVDSRFAGNTAVADESMASALRLRRRISWGAIFAGVVLVLAVQLLLSLFGLGVGLTTVDPVQGANGMPTASSLGIGAGIWWTVSYIIALIAGGYVAARLAGLVTSYDGVLHGLLTWAFALLVTFYLLTTALGGVIGGAFRTVGGAVSSVGSTATETVKSAAPPIAQATGITPEAIQQKAQDLLSAQPAPGADPKTMSREDATKEVAANLPKLAAGADQAKQARERIVAITAAQMNIPEQEASARLDRLQGQVEQTKQTATDTAKQAADKAAGGVSTASFLAFVALLLGAGGAAFGGHLGARGRKDDVAGAANVLARP
jgi:hypothetical protein